MKTIKHKQKKVLKSLTMILIIITLIFISGCNKRVIRIEINETQIMEIENWVNNFTYNNCYSNLSTYIKVNFRTGLIYDSEGNLLCKPDG